MMTTGNPPSAPTSMNDKKLRRRKKHRLRKSTFLLLILICCIITVQLTNNWLQMDFGNHHNNITRYFATQLDNKQHADNPWNLVLVNAWHQIPANYQVTLITLKNNYQVDERIYPALQKMFDAARQENVYPLIASAYRTSQEQQKLLDKKIQAFVEEGNSRKQAQKLAKTYVAIPGTSEHQLGLALDINADKDQCTNETVYQWLEKNSYKYGFIMRYPASKTTITGVSYEPWHYRYVGKEAANTIYQQNICLEEYLDQQPLKYNLPHNNHLTNGLFLTPLFLNHTVGNVNLSPLHNNKHYQHFNYLYQTEVSMKRKLLTQIFPFLLPVRQQQQKIYFYLKMRLDKNTYAQTIKKELLPYEVFTASSLMLNQNSGFDMKYQLNKVYNLKLAAQTINGLIIQPQETFSFCQQVQYADRHQPFKDGLKVINGKIVTSPGGGLCQLSNLLFWLFLHTPLTITERHGHALEAFPTTTTDLPLGTDATVKEGWLDLKITNNTKNSFQIVLDFDEQMMYGKILANYKPSHQYEIFNNTIIYYQKQGKTWQQASVDCYLTNTATQDKKQILLYENICEIGYPLPANIPIEHKGGKNNEKQK